MQSNMSPKLRSLYLNIWAGLAPPHGVTSRLHYLDTFFPRHKLESALKWLVRNKITGQRFVDWIETDCFGSQLEMHRKLLQIVEKERYMRVLTNKDLSVCQ